MKPIGPLMIEHRVIERMLGIVERERRRIAKTGSVDRDFLGTCLEFFRTYVDQFHHGKEEDILFRALKGKHLTPDHQAVLQQLLAEHREARSLVKRLEQRIPVGAPSADDVRQIARDLEQLLAVYPAHIDKEDKHFFLPAMNYFSEQEQAAMLEASRQFDREFTQQRYLDIMRDLEEREAA